jgi:ubiquinone/menaquinone biosynthesis C-methylase UbiE
VPWRAGTFDAAVTMNAMYHIAHFEQVLKEMLRVVQPGEKTHPRERYELRERRTSLRDRGPVTPL